MNMIYRAAVFAAAMAGLFAGAAIYAQPVPNAPSPTDAVTSAVAAQIGELTIRGIQCSQQTLGLNSAYLALKKEFEDYKATHGETKPK